MRLRIVLWDLFYKPMPRITKNAFKVWFLVAHRYAFCVKVLSGVSSRRWGSWCSATARWGGMGREAHKGGSICILTGDTQCRTAATNTTLQSNYLPIKKKKKMRLRRPLFYSIKVAVWPVLDFVLVFSTPSCVEAGHLTGAAGNAGCSVGGWPPDSWREPSSLLLFLSDFATDDRVWQWLSVTLMSGQDVVRKMQICDLSREDGGLCGEGCGRSCPLEK